MNKNYARIAYTLLLTGALMFGATSAQASTPDDHVALEAWRAISKIESDNGIPRGLLHSMSLVESGRSVNGALLPWPYTIHVNATKSYEFQTPLEALKKVDNLRRLGFKRFSVDVAGAKHKKLTSAQVEKILDQSSAADISVKGLGYAKRFADAKAGAKHVRKLIQNNYKNVDVGLMQINWYYHGKHFTSVEEAFDPAKNASYAVTYLSQHRKERDWWNSVGRYHSGTKEHAKRYIRSVYAMYRRVHRIASSS